MEEMIDVICISSVKAYKAMNISGYKIGEKYKAHYLYDKVVISDNDYIEFEWVVYLGESNHYQFSGSEFKQFFISIGEFRDNKISKILM